MMPRNSVALCTSILITLWMTSHSTATLNDLDLSNVDLQNFRFFKYPHKPAPIKQPLRLPAMPPIPAHLLRKGQRLIVLRHIVRPMAADQQQTAAESAGPLAKVRAVFGYVGGVLFGNLPTEPEIPVRFNPDAAYRLREQYQRKFGYRGAQLIEQLGKGGGAGKI